MQDGDKDGVYTCRRPTTRRRRLRGEGRPRQDVGRELRRRRRARRRELHVHRDDGQARRVPLHARDARARDRRDRPAARGHRRGARPLGERGHARVAGRTARRRHARRMPRGRSSTRPTPALAVGRGAVTGGDDAGRARARSRGPHRRAAREVPRARGLPRAAPGRPRPRRRCSSCSPSSSRSRSATDDDADRLHRRAGAGRARRPLRRRRGIRRRSASTGTGDDAEAARSGRRPRSRCRSSVWECRRDRRPRRSSTADVRRRPTAPGASTASSAGDEYRWSVEVYAPTHRARSRRTRSPTRTPSPSRRTRRARSSSTSTTTSLDARAVGRDARARRRAPGRPRDLRAARARLLDRRRDRARPRSAAPTAPSRATRRAPRSCEQLAEAGINTVHLLPTFDIATIEENRAAQATPCVRPGVVRSGIDRAAGLPRVDPRPRRLQLGLRPVPLPGARGLLRGRPERRRPRRRVPRDGRRAARHGPAGRARRGVQPHRGIRPGREVGARPDRARLLPAPERGRQRRDLDVLPERRDRARGRREAHGRLGGAVGEGVQGRRLPLRPHGPPLEGEHARRPRRARRAHARGGRRRRVRRSTSTARAGTSARSRTTPSSSRPRRASSAARASARSTTGCATPCTAAARSTARRRSTQGFGTGPRHRPERRRPIDGRPASATSGSRPTW